MSHILLHAKYEAVLILCWNHKQVVYYVFAEFYVTKFLSVWKLIGRGYIVKC